MAADVFEAKDFSNLTHWQSLAWHDAPRDHWRDTVPSVNDCSRTAPPPAPSRVAGKRRNQWLASVGITGWNASESPAGSRRITQVQLTTDGHKAYLDAVEGAFGADVDYAMLIKLYGEAAGPKGRYSPAECTGAIKTRVEGRPDAKHISTSYVERQTSPCGCLCAASLG